MALSIFPYLFLTKNILLADFGVCLIQADIKNTVQQTVENAVNLIRRAVQQHSPKIVALSECFYSSYDSSTFAEIAEPMPDGFTCTALRSVAKELGVYVIGGSIIERDTNNDLYNTAPVFGPNGELVARHRKVSTNIVIRLKILMLSLPYRLICVIFIWAMALTLTK